MLEFLPRSFQLLYRAITHPIAYARATRAKLAPEFTRDDITPHAQERVFRVEIIQDAFCTHRPKPERLFRKPTGHRGMAPWCGRSTPIWKGKHICESCADALDLFRRAAQGDWQAECRLHRLAQRGARMLLAERGEYEAKRRRLRAERVPAPPPEDPSLFSRLGWMRWHARRALAPEPWFIIGRREAETRLLDQHARKLLRQGQRRAARERDKLLAREAQGDTEVVRPKRSRAPRRTAQQAEPAPRPEAVLPAKPARFILPCQMVNVTGTQPAQFRQPEPAPADAATEPTDVPASGSTNAPQPGALALVAECTAGVPPRPPHEKPVKPVRIGATTPDSIKPGPIRIGAGGWRLPLPGRRFLGGVLRYRHGLPSSTITIQNRTMAPRQTTYLTIALTFAAARASGPIQSPTRS